MQQTNRAEPRNQRILVVDDEPSMVQLAEAILSKLGYKVISYSNSILALEMFKDFPEQFDLVITDFKMPKLDGVELCRRILRIRPGIPVIICAGAASDIDEDVIHTCGACDFIRKPFLTNVFVSAVSTAINRTDNPRAERIP